MYQNHLYENSLIILIISTFFFLQEAIAIILFYLFYGGYFVNGSMLLEGMGYDTPSFCFYICLSPPK